MTERNIVVIRLVICLISLPVCFNIFAQPINKTTLDGFNKIQSVTIETADYTLQSPITWQVDSSKNLLTIMPRLLFGDSLSVSIYAFETKVLPFKAFMKDPTVDFDATTSITAGNNSMLYKVSTLQHCDTCTNRYRKREQYYSVTNNKIYTIYYTVSDKLLKRYQTELDMIVSSFKLKQ